MNFTQKQILKHLQEKNNARLQKHAKVKSMKRKENIKTQVAQLWVLFLIFAICIATVWMREWNIEVEAYEEAPKQTHTETLEPKPIEHKEDKIKTQYERNFEDSINFIADFEGFKECAYWDVKRYSVWYGTPSYKWECISKQEALQRKKEFVKPKFELVDKDCFTDNQKIALTSYMYNTWGYQMNLQTYIKRCDKASILFVMNKWGWNSRGLAKRRTIEINKFKW